MEIQSAALDANGEALETRWFGVGSSSDPHAHSAGRAAAEAACAGRIPALVTVFASETFDLRELLAAINDVTGDAPLVGCSTAGEIASSGPTDAGVVVTAIGGEDFSVATTRADVAGGLRAAGAEVASCAEALDGDRHKVMVLLSDGLSGDQQEIVRGAYSVLGVSVPLVGGCAGDDLKMARTYQFHGRDVLEGAVVGAAIGSPEPFGIGVRHGWRPVGEPMLVTRSSDNRVYTLNDRPALDVYLDRLHAPPEARCDPESFTRFALTHPLGLARRSGEPQVRFISGADFEGRSLGCIAEVPQSGLVWTMEGDGASVLDATEAACTEALDALGSARPIGLMAFDCIARKGILGNGGISAEVDKIAEHAGGAPVAGFYTYGEIARTRGISGFHNQTLVVLAVS